MRDRIVLSAGTWYPAPCVRARCAVRFVQNAKNLDMPVVIVDGGSHKEFREEIQDTGGRKLILLDEVEHPRGVLGPGRRQAIAEGFRVTNGQVSNHIEPEKLDMPRFMEMLCKPIIDGKVDLVIPRRKSLRSYPTAQQHTETAGNLHFYQTTGLDWDMFFGPRIYNAAAGKYFLEYNDRYGGQWDSIHIPPLECYAAGLRIATPEIDYIHPAEQSAEEENSFFYTRKRFEQLVQLAPGTETEAKRLGLPRQ